MKQNYELECTCPGCSHTIFFNWEESQSLQVTTGLENFILRVIVCPDCNTVVPHAMITPDTGELMNGFDFNVQAV